VWFEPYVAPWARNLREERGFWLYPTPQERETLTDSEISDSASSHSLQSSAESVIVEVEAEVKAEVEVEVEVEFERHPLRKMANVIKIRAFKGLADCGEDPDEFIDDVEMAADAWDSAKGDKADAAALEKSLLRFFRHNLEPNFEAAWWWQGLSKADRGNWSIVKKAFLEKVSGPRSTGSDVDYDETNEILALTQKAGQSIEEYVREAEKLSRRVKPVLKHTLAAAVIKGLNDEQKRREVSFALSGTKFDFEGAVEKIKAAYRCIGEPDPFKPKDNTRMWASNNPFWSVPGGAGPSAIPVMNAMGPPPIPVMAALSHRRTTSYDSGTQSHVNANSDRPSTADGVMPGPMAQEDFNRYMDAYMRKQKGSDFLPPAQAPLANAPAVRGAGAWITCYSCGKRGHRATECTGTPLSWEEQPKVRERVALEVQEYRDRRQAMGGPSSSTAASTPNTITLEQPRIMHRVNNIQLVRMGDSRATMEAFAMLQRVPGVLQAVRNAAMAVRRTQEEAGLEPEQAGKEKLRKMGDGGVVERLDSSLPVEKPADPVEEVESTRPISNTGSDLESLKGLISQEVDKAIRRAAKPQNDTILQAPPIPAATRLRIYAPIRMMKNETKYDLECILRDIVPKISLPQLLDISPGSRQELKDLLQSTIPRLRKKRAIPLAAFGAPVVTAMAADDKDVSCLYIDSYVNGYKVDLTLVDGGAQIELVSEAVIKAIQCKTYSCKDTAMRLANDSVVPLPCYAWLDINVSGVLARVKAYVMPIEMSFLMLLSRRRLARVQAIEDHSNNVLQIKGVDGVVHIVPGSPAQSKANISIASQQTLSRDEEDNLQFDDAEAAEQAIDIILDELDHWEDSDQQPSGNGQRLR
jgi:hypothetical protein